MTPPSEPIYRDWYSISVTAIRRGVVLGVLAGFALVGFFVYRQWEKYDLQQRAIQTVEQAEQRIEDLEEREDFALLRAENQSAWEFLETAKAALVDGDYARAYDSGRRSLVILHDVLQIGGRQATIRFFSVEGSVEYRRGERGAWKRAREHVSLDPGDWVKTGGDGTAEILFEDGSNYLLRPGTMVHLGDVRHGEARGPSNANVVFGWVELSTAQRSSRVSTPKSEAEIRRDSEAMIAYDRDKERARFASIRGSLEVRTQSGEARELSALQQVDQDGDALGQTKKLPERPRIAGPIDNAEVDLDAVQRLTLTWQPVERARRYWLRVAESRLFATSVIEDMGRRKTSATLGLRREGSFYWQVAAIGPGDEQGPWSEPRSFRVASLSSIGVLSDDVPPELEIQEIQTYGSLVIVKGHSEPGVTVTVNDERASVNLDGTFDKTIQLAQEGWATVEIVATDAAGNTTRKRGRVRIDVY